MLRMRTIGGSLCALALLVALLLASGCEERSNDSEESSEPAVQYAAQADLVALANSLRETQERLAAAERQQVTAGQRNLQNEQRVAALEQRVGGLQTNVIGLTQENTALRQQVAQQQAELAATQEQMRRMQAQANRARRVVRDRLGR